LNNGSTRPEDTRVEFYETKNQHVQHFVKALRTSSNPVHILLNKQDATRVGPSNQADVVELIGRDESWPTYDKVMRRYLEMRVVDIGEAENTNVDQGLLM
jgi:hypothetical protein